MKGARSVALWRATWLALAFCLAHAADVDKDFAHDGSTTYCQGLKPGMDGGSMDFPALQPGSAGKCPIVMQITPSLKTAKIWEPIIVDWFAQAQPDVKDNMFPRAINAETKKANDVIASFIRACKGGTNCKEVSDAGLIGPVEATTGPFGDDGKKVLRQARLVFEHPGEYIIVGKAVLPGDAELDISATEFVAFQKVKVVDPATPAPAGSADTPKPNEAGPVGDKNVSADGSSNGVGTVRPSEEDAASNKDEVMTGPTGPGASPDTEAVGDDPKSTSESKTESTSSPDKGANDGVKASTSKSGDFFKDNSGLLIAVFVGCAVVGVVGFAIVTKRKTEQAVTESKHYERHDAPDNANGSIESGLAMQQAADAIHNPHAKSRLTDYNADQLVGQPGHPSEEKESHQSAHVEVAVQESMKSDQLSEISSLASEQYGSNLSIFDNYIHDSQQGFLQSFDYSANKPSDASYDPKNSLMDSELSFSMKESYGGFADEERSSRFMSEISEDSYVFRPSRPSEADSYQSRVSSRVFSTASYPSSRPSARSTSSDWDTYSEA